MIKNTRRQPLQITFRPISYGANWEIVVVSCSIFTVSVDLNIATNFHLTLCMESLRKTLFYTLFRIEVVL